MGKELKLMWMIYGNNPVPKAREHAQFWKASGKKQIQKKIQDLLKAIVEDPYQGIGQPEQLKHKLAGYLSRRINQEHRIIYDPYKNPIEIISLRGHYEKN